jgi:hypothetical protein
MATEEIKQAFLKYAKENELSAFNTPYYFAKQILSNESLFLKMKIIEELMESGIMQMINEKWVIKV